MTSTPVFPAVQGLVSRTSVSWVRTRRRIARRVAAARDRLRLAAIRFSRRPAVRTVRESVLAPLLFACVWAGGTVRSWLPASQRVASARDRVHRSLERRDHPYLAVALVLVFLVGTVAASAALLAPGEVGSALGVTGVAGETPPDHAGGPGGSANGSGDGAGADGGASPGSDANGAGPNGDGDDGDGGAGAGDDGGASSPPPDHAATDGAATCAPPRGPPSHAGESGPPNHAGEPGPPSHAANDC